MPIPTTDAMIIQAEIKARIFEEAFVQLGREFAKQNPQGLAASATPIVETLNAFSAKGFLPPAASTMNALQLKEAQDIGLSVAIEAVQVAFTRFAKPRRARP